MRLNSRETGTCASFELHETLKSNAPVTQADNHCWKVDGGQGVTDKTIDISVRYIVTVFDTDVFMSLYRQYRRRFIAVSDVLLNTKTKIQFRYYYPNLERTRWWSTRTRCSGTSGKTISTFTIHIRKNVFVSSFNGSATFCPFSSTPLDTRHILNARCSRSAGHFGRFLTYRFGGIQILECS